MPIKLKKIKLAKILIPASLKHEAQQIRRYKIWPSNSNGLQSDVPGCFDRNIAFHTFIKS